MDLKEQYKKETGNDWKMNSSTEQPTTDYVKWLEQQLRLCGVGSSTYKIAISDSFCTYDFEMELPKTTCIRDISRRLYASFGLKEDNGRLRK